MKVSQKRKKVVQQKPYILLFFFFLIIFSCLFLFLYSHITRQNVKYEKSEFTAASILEKKALDASLTYFSSFSHFGNDKDYVLEDYKIEDITDIKEQDGTLSFTITYSVEAPMNAYRWHSGSGEEKGRWVFHKVEYVKAKKINNTYVIESMATSRVK